MSPATPSAPPPFKMSLPTPPLLPVKDLANKSQATISYEFEHEEENCNNDEEECIVFNVHDSDDDCDEPHVDEQQDIMFLDDSHDDCDEPHAGKNQSNTCYEGDITCMLGSLIGIKRKTFEDIYALYQRHAYEVGFSVRKSVSRYNLEGVLISKSLVCSCEGTRRSSSKNDLKEKKRARLITRTGCKASLKAKRLADGFYEVCDHHLEHNHRLSRSEWSYMHRSQRSISKDKADVIEGMISSGMSAIDSYRYMAKNAGGEHVLGHTKKDHFNFVNRLKIVAINRGDAQTLIDILNQESVEDKEFFFRVMLDGEGRLSNVFWRDSMMKEDYMIYGDVVVFDTTYRTNKYLLPCAPFVGINNHRKNVMFGCAFISNEKIETFEWLFEVFLKSMEGRSPVSLFTDQDQAMSAAIEKVFPTTMHRLCIWHLYQNAVSRFGTLKSDKGFTNEFHKCLSGCTNVEQFQNCWSSMISKYGLQNNPWFAKVYDLRQKWCNAFSKDVFSGGILSSQRSESTNNAIGSSAKKSTSLNDFYTIFKNTVERWRSNEANDEFQCSRGLPNSCLPMNGLLKHASQVYTHALFKDFEAEFFKSTALEFKCLSNEYDMKFYDVIDGGNTYQVSFYVIGPMVACLCKKFEECGLLCCHCLRILHSNSVVEIPQCYIKERWTKFAKQAVWDKSDFTSAKRKDCNPWRHEMVRECYNLVLKAQDHEDDRIIIRDCLSSMREALEASVIAREKSTQFVDTEVSTSSDVVKNPLRSITKGRKKRVKGHLEDCKKKKKKNKNSDGSTSNISKEFGSKSPNQRLF